MVGQLIISLDFELMWGVRDRRTIAEYGDAVLGAREAIPAILDRFRRHRLRATWATVGLLFARNRQELLAHLPDRRPAYQDMTLSPYAFIENGIGQDEAEDPWHYGGSLVDLIAGTDGQEIASHTFSHFNCLAPGPAIEAFVDDLRSARSIAAASGHDLRSLVFPRNQMSPLHVEAAASGGFATYRGNPDRFLYRARDRRQEGLVVRGLRLADAVVPLSGRLDFPAAEAGQGALNIPASRFLRPYDARVPAFSALHVARVLREMTRAARDGRHYHLWWHPHNFGRNMSRNLDQLDRIIRHFEQLRDTFGMTSSNMADIAGRRRTDDQTCT